MPDSEAYDVVALERAVNETASSCSTLWLSFLSFVTYMAVALGSVTHKMLFLESDVKLPLLGVDLPLTGFFMLGPLLLLIFHFYVFLQLMILDRKLSTYNDVLRQNVQNTLERDAFRRRLDPFFLVQLLAGTKHERSGVTAFLFRLIMAITVIWAPIATLFLAQIVFLPYHSELTTCWHRLAIASDLILIWIFWPSIIQTKGEIRLQRLKRHPVAFAGMSVTVIFSALIATFPGERLDGNFVLRLLDHVRIPLAGEPHSLSEFLFRGPINMVTGRPRSLFSNVLVLANERFVDGDKIDKQERSVALRGRDLRGAILVGTDLRKADFTGANLIGARFDFSRLSGAKFDCKTTGSKSESQYTDGSSKQIFWNEDGCAWLQDAVFNLASLEDVSFFKARLMRAQFGFSVLNRASFQDAELQQSSFAQAILRDTSFLGAHLQGATLGAMPGFEKANFQGASFRDAAMQGAIIKAADLSGSDFRYAQMQAIIISNANLAGSSLTGADLSLALLAYVDLEGADLTAAHLDGIEMTKVLLQGADLRGIHIQNAQLIDIYVYRALTDASIDAKCSVLNFEKDRVTPNNLDDSSMENQPLDASMIEKTVNNISRFTNSSGEKALINNRFEQLLGLPLDPDRDQKSAEIWKAAEKSSRCGRSFTQNSNTLSKSLACRANDDSYSGSPYVAKSLAKRLGGRTDKSAREVAKSLLDMKSCPGALNIDKETSEQLKTVAQTK